MGAFRTSICDFELTKPNIWNDIAKLMVKPAHNPYLQTGNMSECGFLIGVQPMEAGQ